MSTLLNWVALVFAGLFEVVWAIYLKNSKGFSELVPTIMFFITLFISMGLLAYSMKNIPIGVAYPVWTGIGAIGTVLVGVFLFNESANLQKFFFLALILTGIIGLKVSSNH